MGVGKASGDQRVAACGAICESAHWEFEMARSIGTFYEFFAGAGMARAGLGERWRCLFANDFDHKKAATYCRNWGGETMYCADVRAVTTADLPGVADLVWASFPCQDLSLAGAGAGLKGERSGTFWPFWDRMTRLGREGRAPALIVLENVYGALTSHGGGDFQAICRTLHEGGYRFGALIVDAALFVPQSRPRLFIVAVRNDVEIPGFLEEWAPAEPFYPRTLRTAYGKLPRELQKNWIWWRVETPPARESGLADLIEDEPADVAWHTPQETEKLLAMMNAVHLDKVRAAQKAGRRMVGGVYKRTRRDETGRKVQRAEVRFDDVAGCLRTPVGGSSRQSIVVVEGRRVRSRLLSGRETARLMGLPDAYVLPGNYNETYHLTGDGVVAPVVRHLADQIFEPVLASISKVSVIPCEQNKRLKEKIEAFNDCFRCRPEEISYVSFEAGRKRSVT